MRNRVRFALVGAFFAPLLLACLAEPAAAQVGCAAIRCKAGFHCVQKGKVGKCVPNKKRHYGKPLSAAPHAPAA